MNFLKSTLLILCALLMLSCSKDEDIALKKDINVLNSRKFRFKTCAGLKHWLAWGLGNGCIRSR
jgi:hypothetical protein